MLNKKIFLLVVLVFATAIVISGCKKLEQKAAEKYIETKSGAQDVDIKDDGISIKDEQGNEFSVKQNKELPSNWPNNVPYYKKGTIDQSSVMDLPGGRTFSLSINTEDKLDEVISYYKAEFEKEGFKTNLEMTNEENSLLGFQTDELSATVGISNNDRREITQTVTEKVKE